LAAIGARNLLKGYARERATQAQQLTALVRERQAQRDRLQTRLESLQRQEAAQQEFIDQFALRK